MLTSTGAFIIGTGIQCTSAKNEASRFPKGTWPERLTALEIPNDMYEVVKRINAYEKGE